MKANLVVIPSATYQSETSGAKRAFQSQDALKARLGAAKSIRAQIIGTRISTNTEIRLLVFETPYDEMRPGDVVPGGSPYFTSAAVTALRSAPIQINGPFSGNVTIALEVKHATDGGAVEFEGLVAATLILEE
ncbi:MAG: hypothetical protein Q8P41_29750 [Pseudomonadota bacterium]|nr:hypothetical protein [Pseudomonadota bacterium]